MAEGSIVSQEGNGSAPDGPTLRALLRGRLEPDGCGRGNIEMRWYGRSEALGSTPPSQEASKLEKPRLRRRLSPWLRLGWGGRSAATAQIGFLVDTPVATMFTLPARMAPLGAAVVCQLRCLCLCQDPHRPARLGNSAEDSAIHGFTDNPHHRRKP